MYDTANQLLDLVSGFGPIIVWISLGSGVLMLFMGLVSMTRGQDPISRRLLDPTGHQANENKNSIVLPKARTPRELMKAFVPSEIGEFSAVRRQLRYAGFGGSNAVTTYFLLRSVVGLLLPGALAFFAIAKPHLGLPPSVNGMLPDLTRQEVLFVILGLVVVGFYGPSFVVKQRVEERRLRISEGFPNALDLMQVSVEAGLGFDAAMSRVASEIGRSSPIIAQEFDFAQSEMSAGRERESALLDMADRMGVSEVSSFVSVVLQSMQFGTSVSDALTTYAQDMRLQRELKAQEKANKLPVQMSAVLVSFMLPALLGLVLAPVAIRYVRIFMPVMPQ